MPVVGLAIHKSQGDTYVEAVYEYDKSHEQYFLYVALLRITNIHGLFIITLNNENLTFYHRRKTFNSTKRLRDEFTRLYIHSLVIIDKQMNDFYQEKTNEIFNLLSTFSVSELLRQISLIQSFKILSILFSLRPENTEINIPIVSLNING